jgi:predicted flap endonuclease-1-like 5' DNA nuclease
MNETATSAPGASLIPETTDLFTGAHLLLLAVLAVLVIAGIIFGMRLARRRRQAERELHAHNAEVREKAVPPTLAAAPAPLETQAAASPPAPEPLAASAAPVMAAAPSVAFTAPISAPAQGELSPAEGPVTQLKGLGPKVAAKLAEQGITTVGQLAALTDDQAAALDARLAPFTGRMGRDRWLEQARFLAAGDRAGFEAVFGRL